MVNRPIKKFRAANIEGAVWLNSKETDNGVIDFKTISISRSFRKGGEDIWRNEVINLRKNDLMKLQVVLNKLQEELFLSESDEGDDE